MQTSCAERILISVYTEITIQLGRFNIRESNMRSHGRIRRFDAKRRYRRLHARSGLFFFIRGIGSRRLNNWGCMSKIDQQRVQDITGAANIYHLTEEVKKDSSIFPSVDLISKSYAVYSFLRLKEYKAVHFTDWLGSGFYCAMARRQGGFGTFVVTHLHGSSEWVRRHNLHLPSLEDMEREGIERSQIEGSDLIVSPSQYMLDWYRAQGVTLPASEVRNWILPQWMERKQKISGPLSTRESGHVRYGSLYSSVVMSDARVSSYSWKRLACSAGRSASDHFPWKI